MQVATKETAHQLPDQATLTQIAPLQVIDENGTKLPFSTLYTTSPSSSPTSTPQKHLLIFIRHFFCGSCEEYVRALQRHSSTLSQSNNIHLTIIGSGQPDQIPAYRHRTGTTFPIFCDPERKVYAALGMTNNYGGGEKKPEYITQGSLGLALKSTWTLLTSKGGPGMEGGHPGQNGGEVLFVQDGEGEVEVVFCHRMLSTRDHAEVGELLEVLDVKHEGEGGKKVEGTAKMVGGNGEGATSKDATSNPPAHLTYASSKPTMPHSGAGSAGRQTGDRIRGPDIKSHRTPPRADSDLLHRQTSAVPQHHTGELVVHRTAASRQKRLMRPGWLGRVQDDGVGAPETKAGKVALRMARER
ncbi:hypothetical protein LTR86_005923 [Recurvomyces mirabilis]|nr:hypothetical protein LTR86_005923 [Recurvomyces mirabilis]